MNKNRYLLVGFLVTALILSQSYAKSPRSKYVGFIDSFDGKSSQYVLKRNAKEVPVGFFSPVFEGDTIIVKSDAITIQLKIDGGSRSVVVSRKNSPLLIRSSAKVPTVSSNLVAWAGDFFNSLHEESKKEITVGMYGRGDNLDQISSQLLSYEPLVMLTGKRNIYLDWTGGTPPYQVSFILNDSIIKNMQGLMSANVQIKSISLQPGEHMLTIQDANGRDFSTPLTVLSEKISLPASLVKSRLPREIKETLSATWLAGKKEGYWRFEAYQRVAPYAEIYSNAKLLKNALENGVDVPYFTVD